MLRRSEKLKYKTWSEFSETAFPLSLSCEQTLCLNDDEKYHGEDRKKFLLPSKETQEYREI